MGGVLWVGWALAFAVALASGAGVGWGVARDAGFDHTDVALDLSRAGARAEVPARLWWDGRHRLSLSSLAFGSPHRGAKLRAGLALELVAPDGTVAFARRLEPGAIEHALPENMEWTALAELELPAARLRRYVLRAEVLGGDPRFAGVRSVLTLRPVGAEVGMGGLMNYALIVPLVGFGALAAGLAWGIRRRGGSSLPWIATATPFALLLLAAFLL